MAFYSFAPALSLSVRLSACSQKGTRREGCSEQSRASLGCECHLRCSRRPARMRPLQAVGAAAATAAAAPVRRRRRSSARRLQAFRGLQAAAGSKRERERVRTGASTSASLPVSVGQRWPHRRRRLLQLESIPSASMCPSNLSLLSARRCVHTSRSAAHCNCRCLQVTGLRALRQRLPPTERPSVRRCCSLGRRAARAGLN